MRKPTHSDNWHVNNDPRGKAVKSNMVTYSNKLLPFRKKYKYRVIISTIIINCQVIGKLANMINWYKKTLKHRRPGWQFETCNLYNLLLWLYVIICVTLEETKSVSIKIIYAVPHKYIKCDLKDNNYKDNWNQWNAYESSIIMSVF